METPDTLQEAIIWFSEFENCRQFMVELRWQDDVVKCPQCGSDHVFYIPKERVWKCYGGHKRAKFSLKTGTIFEDSPIPLEKWLPAVWLIAGCKNGISSYEVHRGLKVTQKTAWFMLHRIRLAMQSGTFMKLSGEIEADETFIGGKVIENVEKGSTIYSDALKSYSNVGVDGFVHEFIDHTEEYVRGAVHTNGLENFWSLLKRTLKGTYVSVEPFHLQAYCDEQAFRFNNRKGTDAQRFCAVMKEIVGKRLTYDELIGKVDSSSSEMRPV